ncbi:MAG: DUF4012 domain-containing protein [Candidatus Moranbacteria bacterium]|nr:DUF4012 domain-containing protein [Candidatus Moranbacteria bacterium]
MPLKRKKSKIVDLSPKNNLERESVLDLRQKKKEKFKNHLVKRTVPVSNKDERERKIVEFFQDKDKVQEERRALFDFSKGVSSVKKARADKSASVFSAPKASNSAGLQKNFDEAGIVDLKSFKDKKYESARKTAIDLKKKNHPVKKNLKPWIQIPKSVRSNQIKREYSKPIDGEPDWKFPVKSKEELLFEAQNEEPIRVEKKKKEPRTQYLINLREEILTPRLKKIFSTSLSLALIIIILPIAIIGAKVLLNFEKGESLSYSNEKVGVKEAQASIGDAEIGRIKKYDEVTDETYVKIIEEFEKIEAIVNSKEFDNEVKTINQHEKVERVENFLDQAEENISKYEKFTSSQNEPSSLTIIQEATDLKKNLAESKNQLNEALYQIDNFNLDDISPAAVEKLRQLKEILPDMISRIADLESYISVIFEFFGLNEKKKYLVVFEDNKELTATGGAIVSYAVIEMQNGKAKNISPKQIYDLELLYREKIIPPKPLQKAIANWSIYDSNWWADFGTTSEKMVWFYEKTGGPPVDGVIAVNDDFLKDFLDFLGAVEISDAGGEKLVINGGNFYEFLNEESALKYKNEIEKKHQSVLPKLFEEIINRCGELDFSYWDRISQKMKVNILAKNILLNSFDQKIKGTLSFLGLNGSLYETRRDYLSVITSNINDIEEKIEIKEEIIHEAQVQIDGTILNTVTLKKRFLNPESMLENYDEPFTDWIRFYVPEGSQLVSQKGFANGNFEPLIDYEKLGYKEDISISQTRRNSHIDPETKMMIYEENGKTVFANWVHYSPQEEAEVQITYLLPFSLNLNKEEEEPVADLYSLFVQKQPGNNNVELQTKLSGLSDYAYVYHYPNELVLSRAGWEIKQNLLEDKFYAIVVKKED